jgi:subtilisin family serine protease
MNQASHQFGLGYTVHQHKHEWFVTTKAGVFPFDDRVFVIDVDTGLPYADALAYVADMEMAADEAEYHDRLDREWTAAGRAFNWDRSDEAYEQARDERAERDANREYDDGGMADERARHP